MKYSRQLLSESERHEYESGAEVDICVCMFVCVCVGTMHFAFFDAHHDEQSHQTLSLVTQLSLKMEYSPTQTHSRTNL